MLELDIGWLREQRHSWACRITRLQACARDLNLEAQDSNTRRRTVLHTHRDGHIRRADRRGGHTAGSTTGNQKKCREEKKEKCRESRHVAPFKVVWLYQHEPTYKVSVAQVATFYPSCGENQQPGSGPKLLQCRISALKPSHSKGLNDILHTATDSDSLVGLDPAPV